MTILFKGLRIWLICLLSFVSSWLHAKDSDEIKLKDTKKIALMFLTIGDLNHPQFWENFLKDHLDKFNIYIHPKYSIDHPFFSCFKIPKNVPTSWAFSVQARKALIEEAVKDPQNYKFVMLTESCIPLLDPVELHTKLTRDNKSYLSWCNPWWEPSCSREMHDMPKEHRKVNQSSFVLNRPHASICALDTDITAIICRYPIDSEAFPSSVLSFYGCVEEVENRYTTFVDWTRTNGNNPYKFTSPNPNDEQLIKKAQSDEFLFARKFAPDYPDSDFYRWIGWKY